VDDSSTGNPVLANLFGLNLWSNLTLIDACAALDPAVLDADAPGTVGTIRATLWHLIELEHRYVAALHAEADAWLKTLAGSPAGDLSTLRVYALDTGEGLEAWAERVTGDPMLNGEWANGPYRVPASVFAGQALLHAKEHRNQVQEAMTRAGASAPNLSAWSWWMSLQAVGMETPTI
jgi:uncharacterized damage-inducible protein DinB